MLIGTEANKILVQVKPFTHEWIGKTTRN